MGCILFSFSDPNSRHRAVGYRTKVIPQYDMEIHEHVCIHENLLVLCCGTQSEHNLWNPSSYQGTCQIEGRYVKCYIALTWFVGWSAQRCKHFEIGGDKKGKATSLF